MAKKAKTGKSKKATKKGAAGAKASSISAFNCARCFDMVPAAVDAEAGGLHRVLEERPVPERRPQTVLCASVPPKYAGELLTFSAT